MVLVLLVLNAAAGASMSSAYAEDPLSRSDCRHRPDLPLLLVDLPVEDGVEDQSGAEQTGVQFLL